MYSHVVHGVVDKIIYWLCSCIPHFYGLPTLFTKILRETMTCRKNKKKFWFPPTLVQYKIILLHSHYNLYNWWRTNKTYKKLNLTKYTYSKLNVLMQICKLWFKTTKPLKENQLLKKSTNFFKYLYDRVPISTMYFFDFDFNGLDDILEYDNFYF